MKIAQLAPFEEPVPPKKYGGTELVVSNVTEELVKMGHEVHLFATGDSRTGAVLMPVFPGSIREQTPNPGDAKLRESLKYIGIGRILDMVRSGGYDVVHNHVGWRLLPFEKQLGAPMVTTLHGPLDAPYVQRVFEEFPASAYVSISDSQRKPLDGINYVATVYNGIAVERFDPNFEKGSYFAFLGRMSPEKGPKQAILAAKSAGVKLVMAAKIDAVDVAYFENELKPLIDGEQIKFIGEVDHAGKVELLRNAAGLLALIQWEEPFGLFMVEALACGTPVIAIGRGSVPELIEHEKTGYIISNDPDEAVQAIGRIDAIDRRACRKAAETRFSIQAMTQGYLKVYEALSK